MHIKLLRTIYSAVFFHRNTDPLLETLSGGYAQERERERCETVCNHNLKMFRRTLWRIDHPSPEKNKADDCDVQTF